METGHPSTRVVEPGLSAMLHLYTLKIRFHFCHVRINPIKSYPGKAQYGFSKGDMQQEMQL